MSPTETLHRQIELEERRLGMRTLDPAEIALHFGRAAELRALIDGLSRGPLSPDGLQSLYREIIELTKREVSE